jgi:hypothetical protein
MKRIIPLLVGLIVLLVMIPIAWAQGAQGSTAAADDPNIITRVTELTFQILTVILPIIAVWLTHRGLAIFEKKTGMDVPAAMESKIDDWVEEGIHLAAEKALKAVKSNTKKWTGPEKLEEAANYVWDLAQSQGWIEWTRDMIEAKIEARLGLHRANGGVPKFDK